MTWNHKNRAALVDTNAYTGVITGYGQMIQLDDEVAKSVFSLDPEEYCWMDWSEHDITNAYDGYEDALKDFEVIAEWNTPALTIHDLDRWNERKVFFLGEDDVEWVTAAEAAQRWGLNDSTIRRAILDGRVEEGEYRKSGNVWLITTKAMKKLYGIERS